MKAKTLGAIALAGSLLTGACSNQPKKIEQDNEEVPSEIYKELTTSYKNEDLNGGNRVSYPSKYDDWDQFDENGNLISKNREERQEVNDSIIEGISDSLNVDSIALDSIGDDPILIDSISKDSMKSKESIKENPIKIEEELGNIERKISGEVYITIDDGPGAYTQEIAEELHRRGHRATFFLIGKNITSSSYDAMKRAYALGHEFGNHSDSHPNFRNLSLAQAKEEVKKTKEKIEDAGIRPAPYFRFPYGSTFSNKELFDAYMRGMGYEKVFWTIDTRDWSKKTTQKDLIRCLEKVKPGDIILIHERSYTKDKTIPTMDSILKSKGLMSVPYRKR